MDRILGVAFWKILITDIRNKAEWGAPCFPKCTSSNACFSQKLAEVTADPGDLVAQPSPCHKTPSV